MSKIPAHHLRTLLDALNLIRLISTQEKPYDQVGDIAHNCGWIFHQDKFPARLRRALVYVQKRMKLQRVPRELGQFDRYDHDIHPERYYRLWCIWPRPNESMGGKPPVPPHKQKRARPKKEKKAGLFEQFPWLEPKPNEEDQ